MTREDRQEWLECDVADLAPGSCRYIAHEARSVLLVRLADGALRAYDGLCSHALLPLDGARVRRGAIMCPHHGARFECGSGDALGPPASAGLTPLELKEDDGQGEGQVKVLIA
ncbi:Rieske (2Fe-2S) protein [Erythrobacter sp.]|jgi:3-phenylpropionate/trans-cinnamate dioxygenase ferredoxin subunit|uniref:Rieske (2Fe-2S) protein n=1 Tax=Erythrobacter sp. TaxID=1042 RepID=UPI002EBB99DE|nr:Rieske (2Fe-2S) protein [Erythrobacter sp.]